jgi:RHS repeat-associated protein
LKRSFYGTNPHGDTETLTDATTGQTTSMYQYTAYGQPDKNGTTGDDVIWDDQTKDADIVNPYRFNPKRYDGATGTYDMGFREYNPGLNRYLSRDSYNGALKDLALGTDPWNTNRYAFAGGNPITGVELDGHCAMAEEGGCDTSTSYTGPIQPQQPVQQTTTEAATQACSESGSGCTVHQGDPDAALGYFKSCESYGSRTCSGQDELQSMGDYMRAGGSKGTGYDIPGVIFPDRGKPKILTAMEIIDEAIAVGQIMHMSAKVLAAALEKASLVTGRNARDLAVLGRAAPKPLRIQGRTIGLSAAQNQRVQADAALAKAMGATDIRLNQWQVNASGKVVGINRPDLQYTFGGKRFYVEYDTAISTRGVDHFRRILTNDPDAEIWLVGRRRSRSRSTGRWCGPRRPTTT